jgi:hypothetical protein
MEGCIRRKLCKIEHVVDGRCGRWKAMGAGRKVVIKGSCGRWNAVVDGRWLWKGAVEDGTQ